MAHRTAEGNQDIKISYEELMNELEKFRTSINSRQKHILTKEEEDVLLKARNNKLPISYTQISEFFKKYIGKSISKSTLRENYVRIMKQRE